MFLRLGSESGDVGLGNQFVAGFIHCDMAVEAKAENANINRTVFREPLCHGSGFAVRVRSIAFVTSKAGRVDV